MILDTNALSALADGKRDFLQAVGPTRILSVPVVVIGEYLFGIRHSRHRRRYQEWLASNLRVFQIMPISEKTAEHYAEIRSELKTAGRPIPSNDLWIAALAREHALPVLSRDRHFGVVEGLRILGW